MLLTVFRWLVALTLVGAAAFWWLSRPVIVTEDELAGLKPDLSVGEQVYYAGGCSSCHAVPGTEGEDRRTLAGGMAFASDFGTFFAPNISPDPVQGIGAWTARDLVNAMQNGVSPDGQHYYPAFPYTSYAKAEPSDIVSLFAYLGTLPASDTPSKPHDLTFPFNIRRVMGVWKLLFLKTEWTLTGELNSTEQRGRYLSEALGHCSECHTQRNILGGLQTNAWLGGAPNPVGRGRIPNITPGGLEWSQADIAEYLKSGFTPEFDTAGGHMVAVIENTAQLPPEDRAAIAAYLKAVPPVR